MRAYLNEIYQYLITDEMRNHMRNELHLSDDHKKIFDSLSRHSGNSDFHYCNTMIPRERFEYLLKCMSHRHVEELIRLAEIGLKTEKREQNRNKTE